uniref:Uncharacterized protein n=1 Tax=Panagrolaimus sp. JU765 TaxID=591449 RepID=A0AC34QDD7_9BILA
IMPKFLMPNPQFENGAPWHVLTNTGYVNFGVTQSNP